MNPQVKERNEGGNRDLRDGGIGGATGGATAAQETRETEPELAGVIDAWANLPVAVKAGIVAMVRAAVKE